MARKALPSQDALLQLLRYNPETGDLTWLPRPDSQSFTVRWAGKPAFTAIERGYKQGRIFSELHYAHRIIWRMVTGEIAHDIDHINGVRGDNRLCNLRAVTRAENLRNRVLSSKNTSGTPNVRFTRWGAWQAYIGHNGKRLCLGSFKTKEEAVAARKAAEARLGYHPNHGRAA